MSERSHRNGPWVIKFGSALLTNDGRGLDRAAIGRWVDEIAGLRAAGIDVVLVSSGAIAEGMSRLRLGRRPAAIHELQALAAIGQMGLVEVYETCFQKHKTHTAQVLLTELDLADRERYLNARTTLRSLLGYGVVPVVNENDTVATTEIRFGDNDTLAGLIANLVEAEKLVIVTDQAGLYSKDPRHHDDAELIAEGRVGDSALEAMAGEGGALGRGGMRTKMLAARHAARSGTTTHIVSGRTLGVFHEIAAGRSVGTCLRPARAPLAARKRWLAAPRKTNGKLQLDEGAARVVRELGRSLLPVGVRKVQGTFKRGDIVACVDMSGGEIARGIVNYGADEASRIMGQSSDRIAELLGYVDEQELIHRDNLVVTAD